MWYNDPELRTALRDAYGLEEISPGHWRSTGGNKEIMDFDGGIIVISRVNSELPQFDVKTVVEGSPRDAALFNKAVKQHLETMRAKVRELEESTDEQTRARFEAGPIGKN